MCAAHVTSESINESTKTVDVPSDLLLTTAHLVTESEARP